MAEAREIEEEERGQTPDLEAGDVRRSTNSLYFEEIQEHVILIEVAVAETDKTNILRVLRGIPNTRMKLNNTVLRALILKIYPEGESDSLMFYMEKPQIGEEITNPRTTTSPLPEVDCYIQLLMLIYLIDNVRLEEAQLCSRMLMDRITSQNRRLVDQVAAKCYFYHSRVAELLGSPVSVRAFLLAQQHTAMLRNNVAGQAVLINCILRNYLYYSLYEQADKLINRTVFPEFASNNEWARYYYYVGRIKAIRLEYSEARVSLIQAMHKAPQNTAVGFKQHVQKLSVVVELLLGDIPQRSVFGQAIMRRPLNAYFQLTQAVRLGDLPRFEAVSERYGPQFMLDNTYTLIRRIRHNVIRTALRTIALAYSRISLEDVANKLGVDLAESAKYIVAKAIKDGVIEATLDPQATFMCIKPRADAYSTSQPLNALHRRIQSCLDMHNQFVRAMRYPPVARARAEEVESAAQHLRREVEELDDDADDLERDFEEFF